MDVFLIFSYFFTCISKTTCWIFFIFGIILDPYLGVLQTILECKKNSRWPTYGHFSDFLVLFDLFASHIETVAIIIQSALLVCVYVPPNTPWGTVTDFFSNLLFECTNHVKSNHNVETITLIGDFNARNYFDKLIDLFGKSGLRQYVNSPTHVDGGILDLIFTNISDPYHFVMPVYFSDHFFVGASFQKVFWLFPLDSNPQGRSWIRFVTSHFLYLENGEFWILEFLFFYHFFPTYGNIMGNNLVI